ncbi:MAG: hypothetical protein ACJ76H_08380 [Bacteriovoracaceae bacterium]
MAQVNVTSLFAQSFFQDSSLHHTLGEEFALGENGLMVFHWADFHETCDSVKAALEAEPTLMEDFLRREAGIERLAHIPVWIKTKEKVHQTSMHELYEKHIFNRSQIVGGVDSFGPIEISFISGTGPFKTMAITECFNKTIYRDFILINLIHGKLPKRDFRVRIKSKVLMEYGDDYGRAQLISLDQLTTNGLLFSLDAELFQKEVADKNKLRIILETDSLASALGKNLEELKGHFSQYAFNLMYSSNKTDSVYCNLSDFSVQSSFDFFKNKKVYLFIPFNKIECEKGNHVKNIKDFMDYTKTLVRDHYKDPFKKVSA